MVLTVSVRAQDIDHVRMTCGTNDTLVIPALAGAEVVGCIANIGHIRAGLIHKDGAARFDRLGYEDPAVGRAAVAFSRVHPGMIVGGRRYCELTPHRAGVR